MPLKSLLDNEFEFIMQAKLQPSEIEKLPYWKFEEFVERLNRKNEQQSAMHKKEEEEHKKSQANQGSMGNMNPSSYINKFKPPKF